LATKSKKARLYALLAYLLLIGLFTYNLLFFSLKNLPQLSLSSENVAKKNWLSTYIAKNQIVITDPVGYYHAKKCTDHVLLTDFAGTFAIKDLQASTWHFDFLLISEKFQKNNPKYLENIQQFYQLELIDSLEVSTYIPTDFGLFKFSTIDIDGYKSKIYKVK